MFPGAKPRRLRAARQRGLELLDRRDQLRSTEVGRQQLSSAEAHGAQDQGAVVLRTREHHQRARLGQGLDRGERGVCRLVEIRKQGLVVDVRGPGEWETSHIEGALHLPLPRLQRELERVPRDRELVLVCKSGYRSSSAASVLARLGFDEVSDLVGGMDAWEGRDPETESCGA